MRRCKLLEVLGVSALVGAAMAVAVSGAPGASASPQNGWHVRVLAQNSVVAVNGAPFSVSAEGS
jgi:hypothetical protein